MGILETLKHWVTPVSTIGIKKPTVSTKVATPLVTLCSQITSEDVERVLSDAVQRRRLINVHHESMGQLLDSFYRALPESHDPRLLAVDLGTFFKSRLSGVELFKRLQSTVGKPIQPGLKTAMDIETLIAALHTSLTVIRSRDADTD
ncbi:MAG: hypothetical protein PHN51_12035 [Candidatus Nanopelagicales bacterium]|nr:hypothetical protein [Candidatus Nanopelagicales bacterium]